MERALKIGEQFVTLSGDIFERVVFDDKNVFTNHDVRADTKRDDIVYIRLLREPKHYKLDPEGGCLRAAKLYRCLKHV